MRAAGAERVANDDEHVDVAAVRVESAEHRRPVQVRADEGVGDDFINPPMQLRDVRLDILGQRLGGLRHGAVAPLAANVVSPSMKSMALVSRLAERGMSLPAARDRAVDVERDVRVPMDDDVTLLADVYTPAGTGPHPTVLVRTPYGRRGPLGFFLGRVYAERGYRVVMQSCRGTFGSGGVFHPNFDERADGLATIRWIERQAWFDGRLAMNGPSYMGAVQWAVADTAGPSLRALCTQVAYSDVTKHWYRGGSFALGDAIEWTTMVSEQEEGGGLRGIASTLGLRARRIERVINDLPIAALDERLMHRRVPMWREVVDHPSTDDPFWDAVDHSARVAEVTAPVLQVGGWYDIFLPGQLADYRALIAAGRQPRLVIGPWTHASPKGFRPQLDESLRWLDRHVLANPAATCSRPEPRPPVRDGRR